MVDGCKDKNEFGFQYFPLIPLRNELTISFVSFKHLYDFADCLVLSQIFDSPFDANSFDRRVIV